MKSLDFFKPIMTTTLAIVLGWLLSVRPAQAGYTVRLQQVGPDVVATGSGVINLQGLTFSQSASLDPAIHSPFPASIYTGPTSSSVDLYERPLTGPFGDLEPLTFGSNVGRSASSGSGDMVGISAGFYQQQYLSLVAVPKGYVSGTALSDTATYSGTTLAALGVTPGTYVWTWVQGGAHQDNFTLIIPSFPPPTPTPTPRPASQAQLLNISTRMDVKTGDNVLIGGFIVTGNVAKKVMLRAIGPSLAPTLAGVLADPVLELHAANGDLITSNDNWKDTQQTAIEATGIPPQNDLESAIVATLDPGAYTMIVSGKGGTRGIGLLEAYDLDQSADAELANISARGFVEAGSNVMIGGFILGNGTGTTNVVIRALGPSLPVAGTLADPTLELHDSNGALVQSNDNWMDNSAADQAELTANQLAPTNDLDSAVIVTLPTGAYTAIVAGNNGATGVGLVEAYRLP